MIILNGSRPTARSVSCRQTIHVSYEHEKTAAISAAVSFYLKYSFDSTSKAGSERFIISVDTQYEILT